MDWTWYLFGFKGRINRAKYWLAGLIILCWMLFLAGLVIAAGLPFGGDTSFGFNVGDVFTIVDPASHRAPSMYELPAHFLETAGTLLFLWVYLATSIKRLHDRDKSAWWMVPFFAVPGLCNQFSDRLPGYFVFTTGLIAGVLGLWGFIEMNLLKGSRKTNRFEHNPLLQANTGPRLEFAPHDAGPSPGPRAKRGHD